MTDLLLGFTLLVSILAALAVPTPRPSRATTNWNAWSSMASKRRALRSGLPIMALCLFLGAGCTAPQLPAAPAAPTVNSYDNHIYGLDDYSLDERDYQKWPSAELEEPSWSYKIPDRLPHFPMPLVHCTARETSEACAERRAVVAMNQFWTWLLAQPDHTPPEKGEWEKPHRYPLTVCCWDVCAPHYGNRAELC